MAFELQDFDRHFVKQGEFRGLFNIARSDESTTEGATRYYAFLNECGSFVFQRIRTSGSLTIKIYDYYAVGKRNTTQLDSDWSDRANKTYIDYYKLFKQS